MADYATDSALMAEVRSAASDLGVATQWSTDTVFRAADSFIMELYLLFRVVRDLQHAYMV